MRDAESGVPLAGVFVVLLDSLEHTRGGVLTAESGAFVLRASVPGTYRLRAERIGHQSTLSEPVVLTENQATVVELRALVAPIELAAVEVEGDARCTTRPRAGARAAQLWEEVRKALAIAHWVQSQKSIEFESRSWVRNLKVPSMAVMAESLTHRVTTALPYAAIPAGTLTRFGFVQKEFDDLVFFGPDADVLLSDTFVQGHCFESVEGSGANRGNVGLAFRPIEGSKLPDIEGTLWLDARTLELRHIEYRYVHLADPRRNGAGGRTDFRRLPKGAWIVSSWHIRVPQKLELAGGRTLVRELRETGGMVLAVRKAAQRESFARDGVITGIVYDSVHGQPLSHALVYLSGTTHRAHSDADGRYRIGGVPAGTYALAFAHPALDSMPVLPQPHEVQVIALETTAADLGAYSAGTQLDIRCPGDSGGILFGYVHDVSGAVSDALITANFRRYTAAPGGQRKVHDLTEHKTKLTARTDLSGEYLLCGLPLDSPIELRVRRHDETPLRATAHLEGRSYRRFDLQLRL